LLHSPEAHLTPAGHGHVFNQRRFDAGAGREEIGLGVEKSGETFENLAFEDDGAREQAVKGTVSGRLGCQSRGFALG
jgi:hypothetical protein